MGIAGSNRIDKTSVQWRPREASSRKAEDSAFFIRQGRPADASLLHYRDRADRSAVTVETGPHPAEQNFNGREFQAGALGTAGRSVRIFSAHSLVVSEAPL